MFCTTCGRELSDDARFCTWCGAKIEQAEAPAKAPEEKAVKAPEPAAERVLETVAAGGREPVTPSAAPQPAPSAAEPVVKAAPQPAPAAAQPAAKAAPQPAPAAAQPVRRAVPQPAPAAAQPVRRAPSQPARPVQGQPEGARAAAREKKPESRGARAAKTAGSVALSILLAVLLVAASAVTLLKVGLSGGHLEKAVTNMELAEMDVSDLVAQTNVTLADHVYNLTQNIPGWEGVSRDQVAAVLQDPVMGELVAQIAGDYVSALTGDAEGRGLDAQTVAEYIMEHKSQLQDAVREAGYRRPIVFNQRAIQEALESDIGEEWTLEDLEDQYPGPFKFAKIALSLFTLIGLWVAVAAVCALLIVLNRKRLSRVLVYIGLPLLVTGLGYFTLWLAGILAHLLSPGFIESFVMGIFAMPVLIAAAALAGAGILMIVVKLILGSVKHKKALARPA